MAKTLFGGTPSGFLTVRYAILVIRTSVFPAPAPATQDCVCHLLLSLFAVRHQAGFRLYSRDSYSLFFSAERNPGCSWNQSAALIKALSEFLTKSSFNNFLMA